MFSLDLENINNNTSDNQGLRSAFNDLDPTHSLLCDVIFPCKKICGGCQNPGGGGGVLL